MGIKEMASFIGKVVSLKVESLLIPVKIEDVRKVFQRIDVLVTPLNGTGKQWVSLERVC